MSIQFRLAILLWVLASLSHSLWATSAIYDDRDPNIRYTNGEWQAGGTVAEFSYTTTYTRIVGATATLTFTGTRVRVYGTRAHEGNFTTLSTYSVDGGAFDTYTDSFVNDGQSHYQILFYTSNVLPNSDHVLTMVNQGDWYILDYILVDVPDATTPIPTTDRVTISVSTSIVTANSLSSEAVPKGPPSSSLSMSSLSGPDAEGPAVAQPISSPLGTTIPSVSMVESSPELPPTHSLLSSSISTTRVETSLSSPHTRKTRLGTTAIAGIAIASSLGVIALLVVMHLCRRRRQSHIEVNDTDVSGVTPFENAHAQHSDHFSTEFMRAHPSFQTNEKRTGIVSNGPIPSSMPPSSSHEPYIHPLKDFSENSQTRPITDLPYSRNDGEIMKQHGRGPLCTYAARYEGGILSALDRTDRSSDESIISNVGTHPPTYTEY